VPRKNDPQSGGEGGGGGAGEGGGGGGGKGGGGALLTTTGTSSTMMPSAIEAVVTFEAVMPSELSSEACTFFTEEPAGTVMIAVMITLPASTRMVTRFTSTPAALATFCFKAPRS